MWFITTEQLRGCSSFSSSSAGGAVLIIFNICLCSTRNDNTHKKQMSSDYRMSPTVHSSKSRAAHRTVYAHDDADEMPHINFLVCSITTRNVLTSGFRFWASEAAAATAITVLTQRDSTKYSFHSNYATIHDKFQQVAYEQYTRTTLTTNFRKFVEMKNTQNANIRPNMFCAKCFVPRECSTKCICSLDERLKNGTRACNKYNNLTTAHTMFRRQSQARTEALCPYPVPCKQAKRRTFYSTCVCIACLDYGCVFSIYHFLYFPLFHFIHSVFVSCAYYAVYAVPIMCRLTHDGVLRGWQCACVDVSAAVCSLLRPTTARSNSIPTIDTIPSSPCVTVVKFTMHSVSYTVYNIHMLNNNKCHAGLPNQSYC